MTTTKKKRERLLEMVEKLDVLSLDLAKLDGMLEELTKRLKLKSGYSNTKKARESLQKLHSKVKKKKAELETGIDRLREDYDW